MKKLLSLILSLMIASLAFSQAGKSDYDKAKNYLDEGNNKKAIASGLKAIEANDKEYLYYDVVYLAYRRNGQMQEGFDLIQLAIEKCPSATLPYYRRGNLYIDAGHPESAVNDLTKFLRLGKDDSLKVMALSDRASAKMRVRNFESAYADLTEALAIDSLSVFALNNLAMCSDEVGKGDQTIPLLEKALRIDPTFILAHVNIGFKYQLMGDHQKAIEHFDIVVADNPNEPYSLSNRAYSRLQVNDLEGAMKDINLSIKNNPTNPWAYKNKGLILVAMGKKAEACVEFEKSIENKYTQQYGNEVIELQKKYCR